MQYRVHGRVIRATLIWVLPNFSCPVLTLHISLFLLILCNTWIKRCISSLIYQHKLQSHKTLLHQWNWLHCYSSRTTKNWVNKSVKLTGKKCGRTALDLTQEMPFKSSVLFPPCCYRFFFQMSSAHFLSLSFSTAIKTSHYCEVERHWVPNFAILYSGIKLNTSSKPLQSTELP